MKAIIRLDKNENPKRKALIAFPGAGNSASFFSELGRKIRSNVYVYGIDYPGRGFRGNEKLLESFESIKKDILDGLAPFVGMELVFLGHSMGALLAYEASRWLQYRVNAKIRGVIVASCVSPDTFQSVNRPVLETLENVKVVEYLRKMDSFPEELIQDDAFMAYFLPLIRSDFNVVKSYTYRPGPSLRCPVAIVIGDSDPYCDSENLQGWEKLASHTLELRRFVGGHCFMKQHGDKFAETIDQYLKTLL